MNKNKIRIGTRTSKLAIIQAEMVIKELKKAYNLEEKDFEIVQIITTGDKLKEQNISEEGGKVLFIKELELALLDNKIDMAVHSYKDMPAKLPKGLKISAVLEREDARDAIVSKEYKSLSELPKNHVIGSSSVRRRAFALNKRPDLKFVPFRGNVNNRLKKIEDGEVPATIIAMAGVKRLGMLGEMVSPISFEDMLPAPTQGIIAIETQESDKETNLLLSKINHKETSYIARAERAFLEVVEGNCQQPLAALATLQNDLITIECKLASIDGKKLETVRKSGKISEAAEIGKEAGLELKKKFGL